MTIRKLSVCEFITIKQRSSLNPFWKKYFSEIAFEFNKMFFEIFREKVFVKTLDYSFYDMASYINQMDDDSYLQFFKISPHHQSFGFYHLPCATTGKLLMTILGGKSGGNFQHKLTSVDQALMEMVSHKLVRILQKPFVYEYREIDFEFIGHEEQQLFLSINQESYLVGIQHFVIQIGNDFYDFDLAFTQNFLGKLQLL